MEKVQYGAWKESKEKKRRKRKRERTREISDEDDSVPEKKKKTRLVRDDLSWRLPTFDHFIQFEWGAVKRCIDAFSTFLSCEQQLKIDPPIHKSAGFFLTQGCL